MYTWTLDLGYAVPIEILFLFPYLDGSIKTYFWKWIHKSLFNNITKLHVPKNAYASVVIVQYIWFINIRHCSFLTVNLKAIHEFQIRFLSKTKCLTFVFFIIISQKLGSTIRKLFSGIWIICLEIIYEDIECSKFI